MAQYQAVTMREPVVTTLYSSHCSFRYQGISLGSSPAHSHTAITVTPTDRTGTDSMLHGPDVKQVDTHLMLRVK